METIKSHQSPVEQNKSIARWGKKITLRFIIIIILITNMLSSLLAYTTNYWIITDVQFYVTRYQ
jgi:hypothetical protein